MQSLWLLSVCIVATCGLIYELIAATLASYLLGDSITQFSTIIGVYLFAMGVGSYLSRYCHKNLLSLFIKIEILIGLVGGCSAALLFASFEQVASFRILLYGLVSLTGVLVGLEIPLMMRILGEELELKELVAKIFAFDYIGALIASLLFPLFLVPRLGLVRSAFLFGALNVAVALWTLVRVGKSLRFAQTLMVAAVLSLLLLAAGFYYADGIQRWSENASYPDPIIYAKSSPYQRITLTRGNGDLRLYLNGNLQFSSMDEYRYHEALVHPGLASLHEPRKVLVLGGGDGLAIREILRYPSVERITLVDLDAEVTSLFQKAEMLTAINQNALNSEKLEMIHQDAFVWLRTAQESFDFVVIDFPDPSNFSVGKLYSSSFYNLLKRVLKPDGLVVIQSTSPYVAKQSFWCVVRTLEEVGLQTTAYHTYVPSFGAWGYVLAGLNAWTPPQSLPGGLKSLDLPSIQAMTSFPPDMQRPKSLAVNRLNNQALVHYFEEEWGRVIH